MAELNLDHLTRDQRIEFHRERVEREEPLWRAQERRKQREFDEQVAELRRTHSNRFERRIGAHHARLPRGVKLCQRCGVAPARIKWCRPCSVVVRAEGIAAQHEQRTARRRAAAKPNDYARRRKRVRAIVDEILARGEKVTVRAVAAARGAHYSSTRRLLGRMGIEPHDERCGNGFSAEARRRGAIARSRTCARLVDPLVKAALQRIKQSGEPLTIRGVSRVAGVSWTAVRHAFERLGVEWKKRSAS